MDVMFKHFFKLQLFLTAKLGAYVRSKLVKEAINSGGDAEQCEEST